MKGRQGDVWSKEVKTVKLEDPDLGGTYDVKELEGGRQVATLDEILERQGGRRVTDEEFEHHFGHLPRDGEG